MGLADTFVDAAVALEPAIRATEGAGERRVLVTGTMDFWVSARCLRRHRISTISAADIARHESGNPDDFGASSKRLSAKLFQHFGYTTYEELDINPRADIVWDLNLPVPPELH